MPPVEFRRKLYKRGSSYETTIPIPLLFALNKEKRYKIVFSFDPEANKWYIKFEVVNPETVEDKVNKNA